MPRDAWSDPKLEEERKDSPPGSLEGAQPCWHLILVFCLQTDKRISFHCSMPSTMWEFVNDSPGKLIHRTVPKQRTREFFKDHCSLKFGVTEAGAYSLQHQDEERRLLSLKRTSCIFTEGRARMHGSLWTLLRETRWDPKWEDHSEEDRFQGWSNPRPEPPGPELRECIGYLPLCNKSCQNLTL